MSRRSISRFLITLLMCLPHASYGQDKPIWMDDVEQALGKEGWREIRKTTYIDQKTKKFNSVSIQLRNGETDASLVIGVYGSAKEARNHFKSALLAYKVTKREATVNKYAGLGDENILVGVADGWLGVTIRKGRVITQVLALSEETGESLGRLVAGAIPGKN